MKQLKLLCLAAIILQLTLPVVSQTDSLIKLHDLKYHSEFEKNAIENFALHKQDTFNLFLAIDPKMNEKEATWRYEIYKSIHKNLNEKNIRSKKIKKQIKTTYADVHERFLRKYDDKVNFPEIFQTGTYNCVSASMLYAMVFDELQIPYNVKVSSNHVYLVANPGSKSIVIETTNPGFAKQIFNGEFKQQYVNYLRNSKLISETEYKNKSVEEIFEEKFNQVRDAGFDNLPGFQYYNNALYCLQNNKIEEALLLAQKAYYFFPDYQVRSLLHTSLLFHLEKCTFNKIDDIDYLAQLSRFHETDRSVISAILNNVINHHLQYMDKENFCDSIYTRLVSQINDTELINELTFTYNLQMSYHFQGSDKVESYVAKVLELKGNHNDANVIFENFLNRKFRSAFNTSELIETMQRIKQTYNYEPVLSLTSKYLSISALEAASKSYNRLNIAEGDKYLHEFEMNCPEQIDNFELRQFIERSFRIIAYNLYINNYKTKAKAIIKTGLRIIPDSERIKTALEL